MAKSNLLCCVVNMGDANKLMKIAAKYGIKDGTVSIGKGTVNSKFLSFLQLTEIRKEIVTMIVEPELTAEAIKGISEDMAFEKPHHGIAFTYSMSEFLGCAEGTEKNIEISEMKNNMYYAIYVIVDKGRADDVIEAANKAGARGGTIVNARGSGIHEPQKLFSIEIEPEKEKVFIIAKTEMKDAIVGSIKSELNIDEPGNGIIYVLEVNEAYGLH